MNAENHIRFYADLPVLDSFFDVANSENYHPLPDSWYIGVTDIENSTEAIENNQYKTVNILGASPIIGLLNKSRTSELAYSFGGDGCVICFPGSLRKEARCVFAASQQIGKEQYNLQLRTAIIPITEIRKNGYDIKVARFRVSDFYSQAVFTGGGLNFAESLLKDDDKRSFRVTADISADKADFSGLECRWKEVESPGKSVISILIASNPALDDPIPVYDEVLGKLHKVFGFDDATNPISASSLRMNMMPSKLLAETKLRTFGDGWLGRLKYLLKAETQIILGKLFMISGFKSSQTDWTLYKPDLALNSDSRKFDDMLRLVISGTSDKLRQLEAYLEEMFKQKKLAYGIHSTDAAIITCMVFAYHRQHIHFIDGSDGGYVKASIGLKKRLKVLQTIEDK